MRSSANWYTGGSEGGSDGCAARIVKSASLLFAMYPFSKHRARFVDTYAIPDPELRHVLTVMTVESLPLRPTVL